MKIKHKDEIWKWIVVYIDGKRVSFKNYFKVSNYGRIWCAGFSYIKKVKYKRKNGTKVKRENTYTREKGVIVPILKQGYLNIHFTAPCGKFSGCIHKLVLWAFVGECPEGMEARHLDDDKLNNHIDNLEWGTHQQNCQDAYDNGKKLPPTGPNPKKANFGETNGRVKLTDKDVINVRNRFHLGISRADLAREFNISWTQIDHIISGKSRCCK